MIFPYFCYIKKSLYKIKGKKKGCSTNIKEHLESIYSVSICSYFLETFASKRAIRLERITVYDKIIYFNIYHGYTNIIQYEIRTENVIFHF